MKTFFCFIILSFALSCSLIEKTNSTNQETTKPSLQDKTEKASEFASSNFAVKSDGWEIPNLTKCRRKERQKGNQSKPTATVYGECDMSIEVENVGTMRVRDVYEYEFNGHKFCYRIEIGSQLVKPDDGPNVSMAGVIISKTYYDTDGDGKFETIDKENSFELVIPKWTRN